MCILLGWIYILEYVVVVDTESHKYSIKTLSQRTSYAMSPPHTDYPVISPQLGGDIWESNCQGFDRVINNKAWS